MHVARVMCVGECGCEGARAACVAVVTLYDIPHVGRQRVHISGKTGHVEALCPVGHEL